MATDASSSCSTTFSSSDGTHDTAITTGARPALRRASFMRSSGESSAPSAASAAMTRAKRSSPSPARTVNRHGSVR